MFKVTFFCEIKFRAFLIDFGTKRFGVEVETNNGVVSKISEVNFAPPASKPWALIRGVKVWVVS